MKIKPGGLAVMLAVLLVAGACAEFTAYRYRQWYAMVKPVESWEKRYEDNGAAFRFEITEKRIKVFFENRSGSEITLMWNKVRYIDPEGKSHRIANNQTLFRRKSGKIIPTNVPAGEREENVMVPVGNIEKMERWTWSIKPLFNMEDDTALENRGKIFSVVFPVEIGNVEKVYKFDFIVTNVVAFRGRTPR
ncbi:MAG: hypothetical protein V3S46_01775 [Nitrospinota bacterium]